MNVNDKIAHLQQAISDLEEEVGAHQEVLICLRSLERRREEVFAHTKCRYPVHNFEFHGVIDGKKVSVMIDENYLLKQLEDSPKIQELTELKVKLGKVEKVLEDLC